MRVILGRYELAVPITSSGMGTLREGADRRLNRKIVIKLIRPGKRRDADAMGRFNREARITARLGHPGIPVLYDFGTYEGELLMVMEHGPAIEARPRERLSCPVEGCEGTVL